MASTTHYRPSPLSIGSPRTSPFKRPTSPLPRSPSMVRAITPTPSPTKAPTHSVSPEKVPSSSSCHEERFSIIQPQTPTPLDVTDNDTSNDSEDNSTITAWPPPNTTLIEPTSRPLLDFSPLTIRQPNFLSTNATATAPSSASSTPLRPAKSFGGDALSRLHPAQVRQMRESFQLLDRDNDSTVTPADVSHMLTELNMDSSAMALNTFFPGGTTQTLNLATYLTTLAGLLSPLSQPDELMAAFSAFDDDDSGQVDVGELTDALLHTAPELGFGAQRRMTEKEIGEVVQGFSGRRAFTRGLGEHGQGKGGVFRYREFVGSLAGGDDRQEGDVRA